jgi:hypothetical protein
VDDSSVRVTIRDLALSDAVGGIGITLCFRSLGSRTWTAVLALAGLLYGAFGVFRLGVPLDWGLLLASGALASTMTGAITRGRTVPAGRTEQGRPLPGDSFIAEPFGTPTHGFVRSSRGRGWG